MRCWFDTHPEVGYIGRGARRVGLTLALVASGAAAEPAFFAARVAPILDRHCTACHGPEKQKGGLRTDSFAALERGAESGPVLKPGDAKGSELYRRVTLPPDDEEAMPADGKPPLSADERKIIELWLAAGASAQAPASAFPTAPAIGRRGEAAVWAPDWRPQAARLAALERELGVRLVPRSQVPTDGIVLRTAGAPARADDAAMAKLGPVAALIVDAELARTRVTDAGLAELGRWENLRSVDLTRTRVTSTGVGVLAGAKKLETVNLTDTAVDDAGVAALQALPGLKRVWVFGTKAVEAATVKGPGSGAGEGGGPGRGTEAKTEAGAP